MTPLRSSVFLLLFQPYCCAFCGTASTSADTFFSLASCGVPPCAEVVEVGAAASDGSAAADTVVAPFVSLVAAVAGATASPDASPDGADAVTAAEDEIVVVGCGASAFVSLVCAVAYVPAQNIRPKMNAYFFIMLSVLFDV